MRSSVPERSQQFVPDILPDLAETELILQALQQGKLARPAPMPPVRPTATGSDQRQRPQPQEN